MQLKSFLTSIALGIASLLCYGNSINIYKPTVSEKDFLSNEKVYSIDNNRPSKSSFPYLELLINKNQAPVILSTDGNLSTFLSPKVNVKIQSKCSSFPTVFLRRNNAGRIELCKSKLVRQGNKHSQEIKSTDFLEILKPYIEPAQDDWMKKLLLMHLGFFSSQPQAMNLPKDLFLPLANPYLSTTNFENEVDNVVLFSELEKTVFPELTYFNVISTQDENDISSTSIWIYIVSCDQDKNIIQNYCLQLDFDLWENLASVVHGKLS